jgi:SAM-dependent methyltransferase
MTIRTAFLVTAFLASSLEQSIAFSSLSSGNADIRRQPIGRIAKLDRSKLERASDSSFYSRPNMITHTDDTFVSRLTQLYDDIIPEDSLILDIMSSHVSHLPETKAFARVDVHGMNLEELNANPARAKTGGRAFVRNLNENPSFVGLCDEISEYDAVLCCVGVQYLEDAEAVFAEVARILKPGGVMIVSFTNRFFFQKALTGWVERGMRERARLVTDYFRAAGGFEDIQVVGDGTGIMSQFLSVGGIGGDPFVAVVATRDRT